MLFILLSGGSSKRLLPMWRELERAPTGGRVTDQGTLRGRDVSDRRRPMFCAESDARSLRFPPADTFLGATVPMEHAQW
jgi:hypothetical protein